MPQESVVPTRIENIGSIRNRGIEVTFNTPLMTSAARTLGLELVASAERNEVVSLGGDRPFINTGWVSGQGQSNQYSQRIMVGEPLGTFFAPRFVRVATDLRTITRPAQGTTPARTDTLWAPGQQLFQCTPAQGRTDCVDGLTRNPSDADRIVAGSANPDFSLGLSNNLTWGKFDASWLWRGEFGGKVFNNTALVYQTKSNAKQGRNFLADALEDTDDLSEPAKYSTRWIEDRTFVRLQNVTVGYTFNLPARMNFGRGTRVYVSGDNLVLLTDYSGYDPEVFVASGLANRDMDYLTYPRPRTYTLGARVQF